jgi:hypothetical protein
MITTEENQSIQKTLVLKYDIRPNYINISGLTSQRTHFLSITQTKGIVLFRKTYESHTYAPW